MILQIQITCMQKDFEIKNLHEYHDLYLKNNTLLLAVFQNFRKMCLKIYSFRIIN